MGAKSVNSMPTTQGVKRSDHQPRPEQSSRDSTEPPLVTPHSCMVQPRYGPAESAMRRLTDTDIDTGGSSSSAMSLDLDCLPLLRSWTTTELDIGGSTSSFVPL